MVFQLAQPIEIVLFHDVLCSWCLLADARLRWLKQYEFHDQVTLHYKAFPTRQSDTLPSPREIRVLARHYTRVAKSNEGFGIIPDLWSGGDPPLSNLPPLVALAAASQQGEVARDALWQAMRKTAFWKGINIARRDVLLELAQLNGLALERFVAAMDDPATEEAVLDEHAEGERHNISGIPAVLLRPAQSYAGCPEWVAAGCRDIWEYRELIYRFDDKLQSEDPERLRH